MTYWLEKADGRLRLMESIATLSEAITGERRRLAMLGRRRVIAAGAGALALALGYRAWDRGVFTGPTGPAFAPWDDWRGSDGDGNRRPLRAAVLAASPHNTQPWLFAASATTINVYADRARHLGVFDPFRREMHLGL